MRLTAKRKVLIQKEKGGRVKSKALSIPVEIETGDKHTMAANDLILSDPMGVVPKEKLLEMLDSMTPKKLKKGK